jgi:hypothetical protein
MGTVLVRCPRGDQLVSAQIEIDAAAFERLGRGVFRLRCPTCGSEHAWSEATARLVSDPLLLVAEELQGSIER